MPREAMMGQASSRSSLGEYIVSARRRSLWRGPRLTHPSRRRHTWRHAVRWPSNTRCSNVRLSGGELDAPCTDVEAKARLAAVVPCAFATGLSRCRRTFNSDATGRIGETSTYLC
ncbi:hypothetical protein BD309DRAFT_604621 [Dichomitus squalens]|uniref:Uncharacterized protein n=1 Tax=Dichomitus squalens TaxID=114155 RepID=A0A4V2K8Q2_9APHY|nr:hypothetical protein BD309DRAFT_604621 [Dichomitus squalens]TBU60878.1 hypothetical protein BD310DRAFT_922273 [Dichomitus squalens]